nr:LamG-like jellyroll fold domain-containing protein [uncultured Carboxylicivirga sp.]
MKNTIILCSLILFSLSTINAQIPIDSLIGYWPFNTNANDLSINNNHGTVNGATLVEDRFGILNHAYHFDGNDNISIPHSETLNMQDSLSFSVWVKPESLSGTRMVFGKSNYVTKTNYLLRIKPDGYIQWEYNGYTDTNTNPLQLNTWHHIVVTASGPGKIKRVYIDNLLVKETLTSSGPFGLITNPLTFGSASYNSEYFIGDIDDIRMYNKVLSETEIEALFNESCNTVSSITETACETYTLNGETYTETGIYTQHLNNVNGCDSTITLNLTIKHVDASVTINENTLTANQAEASYQWIDCDNNSSPMDGETNESCTVTSNGNYAVQVTYNGCTILSDCYSINSVGIMESTFDHQIELYPNPTNGELEIDLGYIHTDIKTIIRSVNGQTIRNLNYKNQQIIKLNLSVPQGIYIITLIADNKTAVLRVLKE